MDLISSEHQFFPKNKLILQELPIEKFNCSINKYIIEKNIIINGNIISNIDDYPFLDFNKNFQNISNEYLLKSNKFFEIGEEFFTLIRKKLNILIIMNKNEQKIKDMNAILFYIMSNNPNFEDSISVTIIMCTYNYIIDYKPNCLFHDKPYYFYSDFCTKNKEKFENFLNYKIPKFKTYNLNLYEINQVGILYNLGIKPIFLPQFIFYDKNCKILYFDNLFQETPKKLNEICKEIFNFINFPYNPKKKITFGKKNNIKINTFFDKINKIIKQNQTEKICENEEEFNKLKIDLFNKIFHKNIQKNKSCKIYFVKLIQNLNKNLQPNSNSKIIYLKPIITYNKEVKLHNFLFLNKFLTFPKTFQNLQNDFLNYSLNCVKSYIENTQIKCNIIFNTIKITSNTEFKEKRELNVEYHEGFENYCIPLNFKILFRDKSKFFNINFYPKVFNNNNNNNDFKITFKDMNDKEKEFKINENEITILHYFREDLYINQFDLGEKIKYLKNQFPKIKFRYCLCILIPCDKFKNSIYFEGILSFIKSCQIVDEILFFNYVNSAFKDLTKIVSNGPFVYIFDLQKKMNCFEIVPGERKKTEFKLVERVKNILSKNYEFFIDKNMYKNIKNHVLNKILELNEINFNSEIIKFVLVKKRIIDDDNNNNNFIYKLKIIKFGKDEKMLNKLNNVKNQLINIIGKEAEIINFD